MFSRIQQRFGTAGLVVSIVALVAVLGGAAYAAGPGLNGKQKNEVKKIAKTEAKKWAGEDGAPGANGKDGTNGTNGTNGKDGTNGTNGTDGTDGVTGATGTTGKGTTGNTGATGNTGNNGSAGATGATGATGVTGNTGPTGPTGNIGPALLSGQSETGGWGANFNTEGFTAISFNIPLAAALSENNVIIVPEGGTPPANCENANHAGSASVANPEAKAGFLCVYVNLFAGGGSLSGIFKLSGLLENGASVSGAALGLASAGADAGYGSWAVTAP
jgi:Collagen triple helix repeat (20 copies)